MKFIGRRLEIYWGDGTIVSIEKRTDNKNNLSKERDMNAKLFNIVDYDGMDVLQEVTPSRTPTGEDLNTIFTKKDFWCTEKELEDGNGNKTR